MIELTNKWTGSFDASALDLDHVRDEFHQNACSWGLDMIIHPAELMEGIYLAYGTGNEVILNAVDRELAKKVIDSDTSDYFVWTTDEGVITESASIDDIEFSELRLSRKEDLQ